MSQSEPEYEYEEELEDIAWEKEEIIQPPAEVVLSSDTLEITINPNEAAIASKPKTAKLRKRYREEDYQLLVDQAETLLAHRLRHFVDVANWCLDSELQALAQSMLPLELLSLNDVHVLVDRLVNWTADQFKVLNNDDLTEEEGRDGAPPGALQHVVLEKKAGSVAQITQVLLALLLSLGVRCRLVCWLPIPPLAPATATPARPHAPRLWIEVCNPVTEPTTWSPTDLNNKVLKHLAIAFVVALEATGDGAARMRATDLTSKYVTTFPRLPTQRAQQSYSTLKSFFDEQVRLLQPKAPCTVVDLIHSDEERELLPPDQVETESERRALRALEQSYAAVLPTILAAFKSHPNYALERHLLAAEVIHPDKRRPVAMFKGEPVFTRDSVEELRTRIQWRKLMRSVPPGTEPVRLKKRRRRGANSDGEPVVEEVELKLYGHWQTVPWEVPAIVDGVLPRNQHGNLEVWDGQPQFVPAGAVFVPSRLAESAAKTIGIQFVPAVVSFETRGGPSHPVFGGVVVLCEHEAVLRDCLFTLEGLRCEEAYDKREQRVLALWTRLVRSMLSRQHLREVYGH